MDRDQLKVLVKDLKSLVSVLESEVFSDVDAYKSAPAAGKADYSYNLFQDDDGYTD
tara:strand:+ start:4411 stop:4578 length:168 start_codon:yes stop_codon:yes gene_type:complete